ncbi:MAG TPA: hypothetical protein VMI34_19185 [Candidatus Bathyarchaeia archaeon]|nr:hypothetical protein [Candidatus Bathyarchaeia archaeon]
MSARSGRSLRCLALALVALSSWATIVGADSSRTSVESPDSIAFRNGLWFDGAGFRPATFYSVGGILRRARPATVAQTIDLRGLYVVPAFGEAHNHNVEGEWNVDAVIRRYLQDGVFYVKIPGQIPEFSNRIKDRLNRPDSIDVAFSNGGFTGPGGHPIALYRDVLREHRYLPVAGALSPEWFDNRAYYIVDSRADLLAQWRRLVASRPDFVKVYLVCSEFFGQTHTPCRGRRGLDPTLLPDIVSLAHSAGRTVSAHVETATDFRIALEVGVDEITHIPGWFLVDAAMAPRARLSEVDARLVAERGVPVITTTVASRAMGPMRTEPGEPQDHHQFGAHGHAASHDQGEGAGRPEIERAEREVQVANLRLLRRHGAKILIGADHADTSLPEALNLLGMGIFSNLELLRMWAETTPRAIFPARRLGRLDEGFEASFLALEGNPLDDFTRVQRIRLRVKAGRLLHISDR